MCTCKAYEAEAPWIDYNNPRISCRVWRRCSCHKRPCTVCWRNSSWWGGVCGGRRRGTCRWARCERRPARRVESRGPRELPPAPSVPPPRTTPSAIGTPGARAAAFLVLGVRLLPKPSATTNTFIIYITCIIASSNINIINMGISYLFFSHFNHSRTKQNYLMRS